MSVADRLLLETVNRRALGADISRAILAVERGGSMDAQQGFPYLLVTVEDPRDALMQSQLLVRPAHRPVGTPDAAALNPVEVLVDGVWYRLRKASRGGDRVTLSFNHRGAVYMGEHKTPISASRKDTTRAAFIRRQVLEAGRSRTPGHRLSFWAYEVDRRMPLAKAERDVSARTELQRDVGDTSDRAKAVKGLKIKGKAANAAQRRNMAIAMNVAETESAPPKAILAMMVAGIGESDFKAVPNAAGSGYHGVFQGSPRWFKISDTAGMAESFLKGGKGFQAGGAIKLAREPGLTPGAIATRVEASGKPAGFYDKHRKEAEKAIAALGGGESASLASGGSYVKPYRFRRPRGEDAWTNTGKLADEVARRRFITLPARGVDLFVYAADRDLLRLQPQADLRMDAGYVIGEPEYDLDYGKTVRSVRLSVLGDPFDTDFAWGVPVTISDSGLIDGKWLVWEVRETDGSPVVELELRQPQIAAPEPRGETIQRQSDDSESDEDGTASGRFVKRGKAISERNYPYVWGGGHARAGVPDGGTGRDPGTGYDCSGYISACAKAAGMWPEGRVPAFSSGEFASSWGEPGEGNRITVWANGEHVFGEVLMKWQDIRYIDTSRQAGGPSGPHVRYGSRSTAGFTPRHWPGV